jgi:hypothetical protein
MATNLVTLIMQYLTPDMIGRISTALGLNRNNAQSAIGAAVPALLAGLSGVAERPGGAQKLVDAAKQQTSTLSNFASMIGGQGQASMIEKGTQMLSSLLGDQDQTVLAGAIGKFAGLGQGASSSLLGMLAPVVMGTIAQQQGTSGLNTSGLTSLLSAQKDNIVQALPSSFKSLLGGTGLLGSLGGAARTATVAGEQTARAATSAAHTIGDAGQRAAGRAASAVPNWVYWLLPALAVAGLLYYYLGGSAEKVAQQGVTATQSVIVGGLDVGKQLGDSLGALRTSLQGITDAASASAALPRLQEITTQVDKVSSMVGQLSPDQRKFIVGLVSPAMTTLNQLFDKVLAIPGVGEVLKPTIDTLKAKLAALAA